MKTICLFIFLLLLVACSSSPRTQTPIAVDTQTPVVTAPNTPTVPSDEPTLVSFISEPGRFEARLPVSGDMQDYTITKTFFNQPVECSVIASSLNSAGVSVQYCDLPRESVASLSSDQVFLQVRNELVRGLHLEINTEQRIITDNSYPALLLTGQADMRGDGYDGVFRARIILMENRIYFFIMTVQSANWCNCLHQMDQVVDSISIDPSLSIPFEPTPTP